MKFEMKFVLLSACRLPVQVFSMAMALAFLLCLASSARAQIVPCSPGPGGPPAGSIPRAITIAPPLAIMPNVPIPGSWLWVLYENRHLTLLHLPPGWPVTPANQVVTMNPDTLPTFGIPANYELYDLATGPGNIGLGFFYTSVYVIGRDPATGEHRAQNVTFNPGSPPGGCVATAMAEMVNPAPASIGAVQYPQGFIFNHFWALRPADQAVEPGASTPDQSIVLQHRPTGTAVLPPVDEDQILCAPGVSCPNWGNTLIQQLTGDAVHLLLRNQSTGGQSIGWLNLGNAGFGGFNSCAGSVNPCLYQHTNLPAPISGNAMDIAGETFIPDRVWVLWAEGVAPASAAPQDDNGSAGPSEASFETLAFASSAATYKLGALDINGALLGSMTIATSEGSGGGGGGGSGSGLEVSPASIDFGSVAPGVRAERALTIRNAGRTDLAINSIVFSDPARTPFSLCDPIRIPYSLQPHEARSLRVCFQPGTAGVFQNALVIHGSNPGQVMVPVPLAGRTQTAEGHKLAGYKFEDRNGNGRWEREQEPGIAGWRISLTGPESRTTTTDAQGRFEIPLSKPGTYQVTEEQRAGWRSVTPASVTITVRMVRGETFPEILFGNKRLQPKIEVAEKISFSSVPTGQMSSQTLVIKNAGDAELQIELVSLMLSSSSAFSIRDSDGNWGTKAPGPYSIAPGERITFPLRFIPPQAAAFTDHAVISSNDPDRPQARSILAGTGFITTQLGSKKLGIHLLHDRLVPPEGKLQVQPVLANQGNEPINNETIKAQLRIEVDEKAMNKFILEARRADWVKEYQELKWTATTSGLTEGAGANKKFFIVVELSASSAQLSQPGTKLFLPIIPVTVYTPGTYRTRGSVFADSLESNVEGGNYEGQYKVLDVRKMSCPGGVWTIEGTISSWGFIAGGAKWEWKAKCSSNSELEVTGVFYTGAGGVIFDLFPGEVKFKGVIEGAKSAADFSGWFSGVIGEFNVSLVIAGGSVGGVYAQWWTSGATMRAMTWSGEVSENVIKDGLQLGMGNWVQDQADEVTKNMTKKYNFDVELCKEGKVEKGVKKFLSAKLCGFFGRSVVGGIE